MRSQGSKLDFKGQNIYVGIDVHMKSWSVTILSESLVLKKFRQAPQPEALHKFLVADYPGASYHSVYEAGFSGFWTHNRLSELGINNIVVNSADVPTMSKEKLRKTDAVDSGKLGRGLRAVELQSIYIPRAEILEIRSLMRLRNSIVKDITRENNRIKSLLYYQGIEIPVQFAESWSKRFLQWLGQVALSTPHLRKRLDLHIEKFNHLRQLLLQETRAIRELSRCEPFVESLRLLMTVPGIGTTIGMTLLMEIDDISRFKTAGQLAAYIGLIPMCHSSGEKEGVGEITVRKNAILRCYLVQAALRAIAKDPAMTMAYEEYKKRMNANRAVVRIARKLANRIFFVLKRNQENVPGVVE
jgi:transposase